MTMQLFKWMVALAIMLYMPLLFEQIKSIRRQDGKHSDAYIKERVESIYFSVTHFYNRLGTLRREGGAEPETWPDFDRMYCTDEWNRQAARMPADFFVRNYWTGESSLGDFLYANKVEVIDRTGDQATVCLTLHNGDNAVPVLLSMVYEHNDWQIDNMTYYWNEKPSTRHFDWRQAMDDYKATAQNVQSR